MAHEFELTSPQFNPGGLIPKEHTCDGRNTSPALRWSHPPDNTKSLVLIVDDPDAPRGTFVHWVAFNIPPEFNGRVLPAGVAFDADQGVVEGANDFGDTGFGGPCPPRGSEHRYIFRLYALDADLAPSEGASKKQVTQAMQGHVLGEANLVGIYRR